MNKDLKEEFEFWIGEVKGLEAVVDLSQVTAITLTGRGNASRQSYDVMVSGNLIQVYGEKLIKQYKEYHGLS